MLGLGLTITSRRTSASGAQIQFSGSLTLPEDTANGALGTFSVSGGSGTYTFSEVADADSKFGLGGTNNATLSKTGAFDYDGGDILHSITVSADNGVDDPIERTFTFTITNVFEAATLSALALDDTEVPEDSAATINITGATSGSTITVQSGALPAGMTLNSGARTISGTPTTIATASFTLRETLADSANSPRDTALEIDVVEAAMYPAFNDMPALTDALDTTGRAVLQVFGDSTKDGVGATGSLSMANADNLNATHALATNLVSLGFNVSRDCYSFGNHGGNTADAVAVSAYYGNLSADNSWIMAGIVSPWGAMCFYKSADAAPVTITPRQSIDTIELFYLQYPGNGVISVDRGGTAQTADSNGAHTLGRAIFTFPAGTEDVNIKVTTAQAAIFAVRMWNSATERLVIVDNSACNGGWTTANLITSASGVGTGNVLQGMRFDAAIVNFGLNDKYSSVAGATYQANLETIVDTLLAADAPNTTLAPDVVLEIPNSCTSGNPADFDATWKGYVTTTATNTGLRTPLDLYALHDPHASHTAKFYDDIHPNGDGYDDIGAAEADYL